ncbi:WD40-repeat-containing domain protein [Lactarius pseudohatsudake]|nr:WD40-repeat-containing domain protein [Lactarius pseudohatsudake]
MSQRLEYQERFNRLAHESVINAMVVSPDGRRLVTGSDDSTVLVWSSRSSVTLCRFKTHSPVLSLAWVESSKGFIFGCKNSNQSFVFPSLSVNIPEVRPKRGYSKDNSRYSSPFFSGCFSSPPFSLTTLCPRLLTHALSSTFTAFANWIQRYVKTTFFKGHSAAVRCISPNFNTFPISAAKDDIKIWSRQGQTDLQVESWELKVKLPPPRTIDFRREVEVTSVNWENQNAAAIASFAVVSYKWHGIMCWDVTNVTVLWQLPMKDCLQPPTARPKLSKNQPVCFAHEGFAVVGAASDTEVYVWDTERGDQLLSLNHGDGSTIHTLATAFSKEDDQFVIATCTEKRGKFYIFVWATVPCDVKTASTSSAYDIGGNQNELFTRKFWINVAFLAVLVALFFTITQIVCVCLRLSVPRDSSEKIVLGTMGGQRAGSLTKRESGGSDTAEEKRQEMGYIAEKTRMETTE